MGNFQIIYKILKAFEAALDLTEFDLEQIGPKTLGISADRWPRYIEMLLGAGYIKGIQVHQFIGGGKQAVGANPSITLKWLEYLSENSIMQRLYKAAKGVAGLIP